MPTADNLFKFMAVRPPQKVSHENLTRRFIRYASDDSQPKLYDPLLKLDSMSERKDLAAQFVLSASYVSGFRYAAPWVSPLQRLLEILSRVVRNKEALEPAEQAARAWLAQQGKQVAEIRSQLSANRIVILAWCYSLYAMKPGWDGTVKASWPQVFQGPNMTPISHISKDWGWVSKYPTCGASVAAERQAVL